MAKTKTAKKSTTSTPTTKTAKSTTNGVKLTPTNCVLTSRSNLTSMVKTNPNKLMIVSFTKKDGTKRTLFGKSAGIDSNGNYIFYDEIVRVQNNADDSGRRLVNAKTLNFVKLNGKTSYAVKS